MTSTLSNQEAAKEASCGSCGHCGCHNFQESDVLCSSSVITQLLHLTSGWSFHTCVQNDKGLVPADVVPDPMDMSLDKAEAAMVAKELKQLLLDAVPLSCNLPRATLPNYDNIPGNLMLTSLGLKLGGRVVVDDMKVRRGHAHGLTH